jgi:hypothetical protein
MVLLEALIQCGGLEMEDLRERLRPSAPRPWYQAARADEGPPEPAALAGPVAAWSLLRAPGDLPFAAAAMASVARLTHPQPQAIGNACTLVQATAAVWSHPTLSCEQILAGLPEWSDQARRWAGAGFEERLGPALAEARGRPAASAGGAFLHAFGDAALAETLLGLDEDHGGAAPEDWGRGFDRLAKAISGQGRG